ARIEKLADAGRAALQEFLVARRRAIAPITRRILCGYRGGSDCRRHEDDARGDTLLRPCLHDRHGDVTSLRSGSGPNVIRGRCAARHTPPNGPMAQTLQPAETQSVSRGE